MDLRKIIQGCKKGNDASQKMLYDLFSKKLFAITLRYAHSKEDAQDIFQDAFVKVFKNIHSYKDFGSFEAWLKRIFINTALNYYRKDKNNLKVSLSDISISDEENEDENFYCYFTKEMIVDAIEELPLRQRVIFNMIEIDSYSYQEVSKILNIEQSSCRVHNFKAKKHIREKLLAKQKKEK
ncbi:MAG: sigma-70 family RNA polymerase sigma factor [Bacteroidales bacterium]|jgi:RNA polymerase sigma-70 factor (ECF subfamily)|nr:sigma-70 family RNA polymerase sigma factor [Bacteroidales bacterium]